MFYLTTFTFRITLGSERVESISFQIIYFFGFVYKKITERNTPIFKHVSRLRQKTCFTANLFQMLLDVHKTF